MRTHVLLVHVQHAHDIIDAMPTCHSTMSVSVHHDDDRRARAPHDTRLCIRRARATCECTWVCTYRVQWSALLFDHPKIVRLLGDSAEVLRAVPAAHFDAIIHDPPAQALSGELYGREYYKQLRRVLRPSGGALFHYIGDPSSKASGRLYRGVTERLQEAGFTRCRTDRRSFGISAETG